MFRAHLWLWLSAAVSLSLAAPLIGSAEESAATEVVQPGAQASDSEPGAIEVQPAPELDQLIALALEEPLSATQLPPLESSLLALEDFSISLEAAYELALAASAELRALESEVSAAEARAFQAGLKPNPEVEAEIDEVMGNAEMRFFRSAATGVGISQLIERGRKADWRSAVATDEERVVLMEIEQRKLDLLLLVAQAYYESLAAQSRLEMALERELLVQQVYDLVSLKVEGGKAARLELTRTEIELAAMRVERQGAETALKAALRRLSTLWGDSDAGLQRVEGQLALPAVLPSLAELQHQLEHTPDHLRWDAEEELRLSRRGLAVAEGVPDLTVSGGLTRFEETDSLGFRVGVSMPLPFNNANEGNILEAQRYVEQVEHLREADLQARQRELESLYSELGAAYAQAQAVTEQILPAAEEAFALTQEGYRYGKFALLDVLDAQRALVDAREQRSEALIAWQLAAVRLERLIAAPLSTADDSSHQHFEEASTPAADVWTAPASADDTTEETHNAE